MTADLHTLRERLRAFALARDWGQFHSPKNLACALSVEAAELLEHFQWMTEEQSRSPDDAQRTEIAHEAADVLLYLIQLTDQLGIDLLAAADRKMALNAAKYPVGPRTATAANPPAEALRLSFFRTVVRSTPGARHPERALASRHRARSLPAMPAAAGRRRAGDLS